MIGTTPIYLILACDADFGIGKGGGLPWHFSSEMKYFKETTLAAEQGKQNIVLMGRKTWNSIPEKYRPLDGRTNVVLSRQKYFSSPGAHCVHSIETFLENIHIYPNLGSIFVIGGAQIYEEVLRVCDVDGVYVTRIEALFDCDTSIEIIEKLFIHRKVLKIEQEQGVLLSYEFWTK